MDYPIAPIAVRPWTLNGLSERLIVSHYEHDYGGAVRRLNVVRSELASLDEQAPGHWVRALKREELLALGSVVLHELYFGNLGGEGNRIPAEVGSVLEEHHLDFGANATAYIDAFMRNVSWAAVIERIASVRADRALPQNGFSPRLARTEPASPASSGGSSRLLTTPTASPLATARCRG